jgi:hypothetical protein
MTALLMVLCRHQHQDGTASISAATVFAVTPKS